MQTKETHFQLHRDVRLYNNGPGNSMSNSFRFAFFLVSSVSFPALYGFTWTFHTPIALERSLIPPNVSSVSLDKIHYPGDKETIKANPSATQRPVSMRPVYKQQREKYTEPSKEDNVVSLWGVNYTDETTRRKYYMSLRCPKERAGPGKNLPKIAIASFPRAGNGWTRRLLQYATGLYVGSKKWATRRHHPNEDIFPASGDDVENKRVIVIKTHDRAAPPLNNQAVLLIRNPYKAIVSDVYKRVFLRKGLSTKEMLAFFKTKRWKDYVSRLSNSWKSMALSWITNTKKLLVVANERLFANTEEELARIIKFIHQPVRDVPLKCAVKTYYPTVSSKRFNIDPYTEEMRAVVDSCIRKVNDTLIEYKYQTLPTYENISSY